MDGDGVLERLKCGADEAWSPNRGAGVLGCV